MLQPTRLFGLQPCLLSPRHGPAAGVRAFEHWLGDKTCGWQHIATSEGGATLPNRRQDGNIRGPSQPLPHDANANRTPGVLLGCFRTIPLSSARRPTMRVDTVFQCMRPAGRPMVANERRVSQHSLHGTTLVAPGGTMVDECITACPVR